MAETNSDSGIGPGSAAAAALDKAANVVHSAVDKAIGAAAPAAAWIDQKSLAQQERYDATAEYVKQNPLKALGIAFVAGLLVGKILL
jgi:ElaB/YqjD/DUF883 family membrane-anchored ribosome-binding protein